MFRGRDLPGGRRTGTTTVGRAGKDDVQSLGDISSNRPHTRQQALPEWENAMIRTGLLVFAVIAVLAVQPAECETNEQLASQVRTAETTFAKSMANRDHDAFASHIAAEALFFGGKDVLRGKEAVVAGWAPFFEGPKAPFSWEPEQVEVLDSGTLAFSSGPVRDPEGRRVGTFNSIWRREAEGGWKIVFDKGCPPCDCPPKP